ncbi:MAG: bifunctional (p)ppGpp synthetase/guanosine-3',5'-bis(diphosphate) 3'-pyrophosphohydrolase [Acholeplasmatales bacterium]|nr:MAG: bifunctional (p)ppGpp synthetase/guanosine-3',5'-bis(diphosphate) 3'-pyrophosphohydrolase [Acholeplasmatales bacterium]
MSERIYETFKNQLEQYIDDPEDLQKIDTAYQFAVEHHAGQKRRSGEDYIAHPTAVATILSEYQTDPTTIMAGLLHDCIEDTSATFDEIKTIFGEEVALLTEGVTKLGQYKFKGVEDAEEEKQALQAKNYQKMLLAMSKDIRVIIVKLADRLHNMRTLGSLPENKQVRIARETLDIYAPLAHRLGMYLLKAELEDTSFKYLNPPQYRLIAQMIADTRETRQEDLDIMQMNVEYLLREHNFEYNVKGRIKNIYSVFKKMEDRNKDFDDIYDLLALRIIVKNVEACYSAIGILHTKWTPIPNRFKDYIAMPKPNLYQSLHTSVIANGKVYEIQIRTKEMDQIAEYGIAAHWSYKNNRGKIPMTEMVSKKLKWYGDLIKFTEESESDEDVLNLLRDDILHSNVYVFTPQGDIIDLPKGSTPLDFAFRIHTEVGIRTVGAIVNGRIVPLEYELQTGDIVNMKTSANSFGPNDNWLKIVKTSNAKSKIKNYLNKQRRDVLEEMGREEFHRELEQRKRPLQLNDKLCLEHFQHRGIKTVEDLFYEIGKNTLTANNALNSFLGEEKQKDKELMELINRKGQHSVKSELNVVIDGLDNPSLKLSNCCTPIPGDRIIGYVSKGTGIAVHRARCNNVQNLPEGRTIEVHWGHDASQIYTVNLKILVHNRDNILAEIINSVTAQHAKVSQVAASTNKRGEGVIKLKVGVHDKTELDRVISNLNKIKDVFSIERLMK